MKINKEILILTPCYFPNTGGVETHLLDYVNGLIKKKIKFTLLTLSPITTKNVKYKKIEYLENDSKIIRFNFFSSNLYHLSEKFPIFNFIYIVPYFFIRSLVYLFLKKKNYIIHSHGLNCAFTGSVLKKLFSLKHIMSTHSVYEINTNFFYSFFIKFILNNCDNILCVSTKSKNQIETFISKTNYDKISIYTYWTDLNNFIPQNKKKKYDFLFVGRLTKKKGLDIFIKLAIKYPNLKFCIVGNGPEEEKIHNLENEINNLFYLGRVDYTNLPYIYNSAKILLIPSLYVEGFARVAIEGLACGLPIIASNNVTALIETESKKSCDILSPNYSSFEKILKDFTKNLENNEIYKKKSFEARLHAEKYFSEKNILSITNHFN